ncbi:DUF362 domain-containing protein [Desulfobacterales bacterium HSG16]|nr:DUF362 domain-containing protein [Desulfobacterales bacterium HSG16]
MDIATVDFTSYSASIFKVLGMIKAGDVLASQKNILIKPNLINSTPHPVTTSVDFCEAVIEYIRSCSNARIVIAEGCGEPSMETDEIFDILGYRKMAEQKNVPLIDLNHYAPERKCKIASCPAFPTIRLPEIAFTHFIVSLPVLKAHSLSDMTGTLKNMIGFAPPKHYSGTHGIWRKSAFHNNLNQSIIDLNRYVTPGLSVMDASIGLAEYHLGGERCSPPVNKIIAGFDPYEVDRLSAGFLGLDWKDIGHLAKRK